MKYKYYSSSSGLIFIVVLCTFLSFLFLRLVLENGLTGDDWDLLFAYKTFDPHPLSRIFDAWVIRGPYTAIQFYYIGLLENIFGLNMQIFQIINIFFKISASVTLFILISKIYKDSFLAGVSAAVFSIIHSSAGALQYVVKGTEYLALASMNLFFLYYYDCVINNSRRLTFLASVILFITFMLSPIRIYPIFALIFFTEAYLIFKKRDFPYLLNSLKRMLVFYLPPLFIWVLSINTTSGYLGNTVTFINDIRYGSWNLLLKPFEALGHGFFGDNQFRYLEFWKFTGLSLFINTASALGIFLLTFSTYCFFIWNKIFKLNKLFLLFFGPFFAFLFLLGTWIILGRPFNIIEPVDRYLVVPSLGISVFISALICSFLEKGVKFNKPGHLLIGFFLLFVTAFVSYYEINKHFSFFLSIGTGAEQQNYMQNEVLDSFKNKDQMNLIVFFDGLWQNPDLIQYHEVSSNLGYFNYWMLYFKRPSFLGCVTYITEKNRLEDTFKQFNGEFFEAESLCANSQYDLSNLKTRYNISDFRAFQFKEKKLVNITEKVLEELRLKKLN